MRHFYLRLALGLASAVTAPLPSLAASLRSTTTLQQAQVRICDLFDDAGPGAERVLGAGPGPGGRIVVEAAQAAAIARQFGVAWHPSSGGERVVIDRPGRLVARAEIMGKLRAALVGSGAPEDADIEMPGFSPPLVAIASQPELAIEQISYDPPSGQFSATLSIDSPGEAMQRVPLTGHVQEMVSVVVPLHRLAAGDVIRADDVQVTRVRAGLVRGAVLHEVGDAVGFSVRHTAQPGQPLLTAEIGRPLVVQKGGHVMMTMQSPGLSLEASGIAAEAGALGDRIIVINPVSGAQLEAEITGEGQVRVAADAHPRLPARGIPNQVSLR
jgi:flagella basal body P-ring formation protein FlgA